MTYIYSIFINPKCQLDEIFTRYLRERWAHLCRILYFTNLKLRYDSINLITSTEGLCSVKTPVFVLTLFDKDVCTISEGLQRSRF